MPLKHSTSKKAFGQNVKTEERRGKPRKMAEAIAFGEKNEARAKKAAATRKKRGGK